MRCPSLHAALHAHAVEVSEALAEERREGAELPFDVISTGGSDRLGRTPLYCYRPMTAEFIRDRRERLRLLGGHVPALRALIEMPGLPRYLSAQGRRGVGNVPRQQAEQALAAFLCEVFEDSTEFELSAERFERAYLSLETALLSDRRSAEALCLIHGLRIGSPEVALAEGLDLVRAEALGEGPEEIVGGMPEAVVVRWTAQLEPDDRRGPDRARGRIVGLLAPLRLYGDGRLELDGLARYREDGGAWQPLRTVAHTPTADPRRALLIPNTAEDELRGFCNLISRRRPQAGELAWAVRRFELACERADPADALTDHLLALRALLEPEGPASTRLPARVAALCAPVEEQDALAGRILAAVELEHDLVGGLMAPDADVVAQLADEVEGHLRSLLRDVLCGHLDTDLREVADALIAQEAEADGEPTSEPASEPASELPPVTAGAPGQEVVDDADYDADALAGLLAHASAEHGDPPSPALF